MNTETTEVSPVAETQNPAPEVTTPEVVTPEATDDAGSEAKSEEVAQPTEAELQLKKLERDLRKAQRANSKLHQELEAAKTSPKVEEEQGTVDPRVLAREIAYVERFDEKAAKVIEEGRKKFKDFDAVTADLAEEVGPLRLPNGRPTPFVEALFDVADKPHEMIAYLGKNPDVAATLPNLSPYKLAVKLREIESQMVEASKPKHSNAPKPLEALKPTSKQEGYYPEMSDADFAKWRKSQRRG